MRQFATEQNHELNRQVVEQFLEHFIRNSEIDVDRTSNAISEEWRNLEADFVKRSDAIFGIHSNFWPVTGYLTTNSRCTYQIEKGEFFVYLLSSSPIANVMHELFHFYTWYAFHQRLDEYGVDRGAYNDFKEALTVLLNVEFTDLMQGAIDRGYPQHVKLREDIDTLWRRDRSLTSIVEDLFGNKTEPLPPTIH